MRRIIKTNKKEDKRTMIIFKVAIRSTKLNAGSTRIPRKAISGVTCLSQHRLLDRPEVESGVYDE
jgi:hypothetical protein